MEHSREAGTAGAEAADEAVWADNRRAAGTGSRGGRRTVWFLDLVAEPGASRDAWQIVPPPGTPVVVLHHLGGWRPGRLTAWCPDPDRAGGWLARIRTRGRLASDAVHWYRADPRFLHKVILEAGDDSRWLDPPASTGPYDQEPQHDPYLTGHEH